MGSIFVARRAGTCPASMVTAANNTETRRCLDLSAELFSKFLRRLFLALADFAAINDDIMFVRAAIDLDGTEREFVKTHTRTPARLQAIFFDVIALKADRHCSSSLLPQCGQRTSPSSQSTRDRILEKSSCY